jgi:hypothetical protein
MVECSCGEQFSFNCLSEAHSPCSDWTIYDPVSKLTCFLVFSLHRHFPIELLCHLQVITKESLIAAQVI